MTCWWDRIPRRVHPGRPGLQVLGRNVGSGRACALRARMASLASAKVYSDPLSPYDRRRVGLLWVCRLPGSLSCSSADAIDLRNSGSKRLSSMPEEPLETVRLLQQEIAKWLHLKRIAGGDAVGMQRSFFTLGVRTTYQSRKEAHENHQTVARRGARRDGWAGARSNRSRSRGGACSPHGALR